MGQALKAEQVELLPLNFSDPGLILTSAAACMELAWSLCKVFLWMFWIPPTSKMLIG